MRYEAVLVVRPFPPGSYVASLYRNARCSSCEKPHSFYYASKTPRKEGSTYSFVCPATNKMTWIWWLPDPEPTAYYPPEAIALTWVTSCARATVRRPRYEIRDSRCGSFVIRRGVRQRRGRAKRMRCSAPMTTK